MRERHAAYYLQLAESLQQDLWGRGARGSGVVALEPEVDNVRVALRWSIDRGEADGAGRFGAILARFWMYTGRVAEGRRWLRELLALDRLCLPTRGRLLVASAAAATYELDLLAARNFLEAGLAAAREAGDDWATSWALFLLAWGAPGRPEPIDPRLVSMCADGASRSRSAGDPVLALMLELTAAMLQGLTGGVADARAAAERGLQAARAIGAPREVARALLCLGITAYLQRDFGAAKALLQESRLTWEAEGESQQVPWFLVVTGQVLVFVEVDELDAARACLSGLLELCSSLGRLPQLVGACLQACAFICSAAGEPQRVLEIDGVLRRYGQTLELVGYFGRNLSNLVASAGPSDVEIGTLSLEEAWALTRSVAARAPAGAGRERRPAVLMGLSPREAEVLRLVADGKTNRQIAKALVLSDRTVAKHLDHVFDKLGVSSRVAAVALALRNGLD